MDEPSLGYKHGMHRGRQKRKQRQERNIEVVVGGKFRIRLANQRLMAWLGGRGLDLLCVCFFFFLFFCGGNWEGDWCRSFSLF